MNKLLILDPNIRYKCTQCGNCCSEVWEVSVEEDSVKRIQALPLNEIDENFSQISPFRTNIDIEGKTQYFIAHRGNYCPFFNKNNLCELHNSFGYDSKPTTCKFFPFRFVEIGDNIYVGASFACPSVVNSESEPLENYKAELEKLCVSHNERVFKKNEIFLSKDIKITPDLYLKIEGMLKDILNTESVPFYKRLAAGAIAMDMLDGFVFAAMQITKVSLEDCIDKFINNNKSQNYSQIFKIADKKRDLSLIKRVFLGMIFAFRTTLSQRRSAFKTYSLLVINHILFSLRLGKFRLTPNSKKISFSKLSKINFPRDDASLNKILTERFNHILMRKDLMYHSDIKSGFKILLIYYALIEWYACGLCFEKGLSEVGENEVKEAVSYVEKYYASHSDFFQLMRTYPVVRDTIENLLKSKNFPFVMTS